MSNYNIITNDYLSHHGILGQKWGVRRYQNEDGTLTSAGKERYSSEQYKRDTSVYGKSGANRIKKNVNSGMNVSGARSIEANRINKARRRAITLGQIGGTVGLAGGAIGGFLASKYFQDKMSTSASVLNDPNLSLTVSGIVAAGASSVGKTLGYSGGQSLGMILSGYDPSKFRYI